MRLITVTETRNRWSGRGQSLPTETGGLGEFFGTMEEATAAVQRFEGAGIVLDPQRDSRLHVLE